MQFNASWWNSFLWFRSFSASQLIICKRSGFVCSRHKLASLWSQLASQHNCCEEEPGCIQVMAIELWYGLSAHKGTGLLRHRHKACPTANALFLSGGDLIQKRSCKPDGKEEMGQEDEFCLARHLRTGGQLAPPNFCYLSTTAGMHDLMLHRPSGTWWRHMTSEERGIYNLSSQTDGQV